MNIPDDVKKKAAELAHAALMFHEAGDAENSAAYLLAMAVTIAGTRPELWDAVRAVADGDLERAAEIMVAAAP